MQLDRKFKKLITFLIILIITIVPAIPAKAQWIDISTMAKDYGLDALAYQIINMTIEKMAASTVNWINTGFKGSPAFVTNPEAFFLDVGDKAAGDYIFRNKKLNAAFLCSGNLGAKIKIALSKAYLNERQYQCTLTQVGRNFDNFMNNFDNGGWDNFFELTQKPQNNPIGLYIQAEVELNQELAKKVGLKKEDLSQGRGFLSYKKCVAYEEPTALGNANNEINRLAGGTDPNSEESLIRTNLASAKYSLENAKAKYNAEFKKPNPDNAILKSANAEIIEAEKKVSLYQSRLDEYLSTNDTEDSGAGTIDDGAVGGGRPCAKEVTVTPGSVINDKLNSVLGTGDNRIAAADEINELISALLNQLTQRVIGGIGSGLRGLSQPDSSNNNQSFASQLSTFEKNNAIEDYYETSSTTVDTVLNQPPFPPLPCSTNPDLIPIPGCTPVTEPPPAGDTSTSTETVQP